MENKILTILGVVFIIGIISITLAYAYKEDMNIKGPNYNENVHQQMEVAIESGDYEAWIKIREENNLPMNGKMFSMINKDNFSKYSEMYNAMISGDTEKADAIRQELGLGQGMMRNGVKGNGQGCTRINSNSSCQKTSSCQNQVLN